MELRSNWLVGLASCLIISASAFAADGTAAIVKFETKKIKIISQQKSEPKILAEATVEIAETEAQQQQGLMYRTKLGKNKGMLFVFSEERNLSFWMKNTYIDLSISYFNKNKVIVDIQEMKAMSAIQVAEPVTYPSPKAASFALEMNKGWFLKNKIKVGDHFEFVK